MSYIALPAACVGCGTSEDLKVYHEKVSGSHTERWGTIKRTTTYSYTVDPHICKTCRGIARRTLLREWITHGYLIIGLLIFYGLIIYPVMTSHWWMVEMIGSWAIIGYLFGLAIAGICIFGNISDAASSPYKYFITFSINVSRFGASPKVTMKSNQYAQLFCARHPNINAEYRP